MSSETVVTRKRRRGTNSRADMMAKRSKPPAINPHLLVQSADSTSP
jgi:hypothetical protein